MRRSSLTRHLAPFLPLALLAALAVAGCSTPSRIAGWKPLFNGHDLTGWRVECKPADRTRTWWRVEDQTLVADSLNAGAHDYIWLLTEREYADFTLALEFQAYRDSPGNSGVQIRSRYDTTAGWLDGPQVDINPPDPWRTGMVWDETRGNQRWLWPPVPKGQWVDAAMANPNLRFYYADDTPAWNRLQIRAHGPRLQATLNGVEVMSWDGTGVFDDLTHRSRQVGEHGHIALQIHTGDRLRIRFRNLWIKE